MGYLFANGLSILLTVIVALVIAGVLRRILDRQPAYWRAFVVAVIGMLIFADVAVPISSAFGFVGDDTATDAGTIIWWLVVMAFTFVGIFVGALGLLVLGEIILPTGRFGTLFDVVRSFGRGTKRSLRYLSLARVAMTSGLWFSAAQGPDSPRFAHALVQTLTKAGPTFVKIGQVLSTRTELLTPALADELATLQSEAKELPFSAVEKELTAAWGATPTDKLRAINHTPLAAASLAQVHTATLADGSGVVVKVLRPGAANQVKVDTEILRRFAQNADRRFAWARNMGIRDLAEGLSASLNEELDYRKEARNARASAAAVRGRFRIHIPAVVAELSGQNVLVMEQLHGTKATKAADSLTPEQRAELANNLLAYVIHGVFADGIFHADLHPGNILVLDSGEIGLLDFGAIGVIDQETRRHLSTLLLAILTGDNLAATTALSLAFDLPAHADRQQLQRDIGRLMTLHLTGSPDLNGLIVDLFAFLNRYGVAIPGDVAGAFRTIASLQATVDALQPGFDYVGALRGMLPALLGTIADPRTVAAQAAVEAALAVSIARRIPERLDRITDDLVSGKFVVHTRAFADDSDRAWARSLVTDALSGVLAATLLAVGAWLLTLTGGPRISETGVSVFVLGGAAGVIAGAALAFRVLVRVFRGSRD